MSWGLWKEMELVVDNSLGKILILSIGFGTVFLIVDGGDVQRDVSLSTFSISLSSVFLPYAPKPLSVYFYFTDITLCDIHLCICLYPLLG